MTASTLTADRPRGKVQRQRWYQRHARPAETLFVAILPNGAIGLHNGSAVVSTRRDVMDAAVARFAPEDSRQAWTVRAWTFEEGVRVHRLANFADVAAMLS